MPLLLFGSQAATAPVGGHGGITLTQNGANWDASAWYGGTLLKTCTQPTRAQAMQLAQIILTSYIVGLSDPDPDN